MQKRFKDRAEAGRELASRLTHLAGKDTIVLALPRGGVVIGYEVAHVLKMPLDVINVRKLGVPWHEELALGAIATGGVRVLNDQVIMAAGVTREDLEGVMRLQQIELERRERLYRGGRPAPVLRGRTVILVDDGIATGATVRAAISVVRAQGPAHLVLAAPVGQPSVLQELGAEVDELICVLTPSDLYAIGLWYDEFPQLRDAEVQTILARAAAELNAAPIQPGKPATSLNGRAGGEAA